ncbi:RNA polymerase sigma factor SigF, partial [Streptomyces sp. NPDC051000]
MSHAATVVSPALGARVASSVEPVVERSVSVLPRIDDARAVAPSDARELSRLFLVRLRSLEEGTREYQYARNTL